VPIKNKTMTIEIRKAEKKRSKLRLGLAGPSGAGKTMSSLKLAKGIGGKICLIDTERGSGDLYADLFDYDIITLEPPYKPDNYIAALEAAERAGYDIIIIDSLSHAWADEGGLLDQADKMQAAGKNRFTLWADITPQHRRLVNAILGTPTHIIATMRSKQEYAMETDEKTGKATVKKLGLAPVQREGMEYEFTCFIDIDQTHYGRATKDRTNLFKDEVFMVNEATGQRILEWLNSGAVDYREMWREILNQIKRLDLPLPNDPATASAFAKTAVEILTGKEAKQENFEEILKEMMKITDKKASYVAIFERKPEDASAKAPEAPKTAPAEGEGAKEVETVKEEGKAPVAGDKQPKAAPKKKPKWEDWDAAKPKKGKAEKK